MTAVRLRPELKVPWQVLAAFAAAVYVGRSALRGWDLRPDVADVLVFGGLAAILLARAWFARSTGHEEGGAEAPPSESPRDRRDEQAPH